MHTVRSQPGNGRAMEPKQKANYFKVTSLVVLVVAGLLLLGIAVWKSYTLFGGRAVTMIASNDWTAPCPMATHDATDLDLWQAHEHNYRYDAAYAMETDGRIVLLNRGTKARLLWERYGDAHIRVVDGPFAGSEGIVPDLYVTEGYVDSNTNLPLDPP